MPFSCAISLPDLSLPSEVILRKLPVLLMAAIDSKSIKYSHDISFLNPLLL